MAEWVDFEHINEHHRFQTAETWSSDNTSTAPTICWICGKTMEEHWFPKTNLAMKAAILNQADEVAKQAWDNG